MGKRKLRVGFTFDLVDEHTLGSRDPQDRYHEFDTPRIVRDIVDALHHHGYSVLQIGNFEKLRASLPRIKRRIDIVLNTAEGLTGRNREAEVPMLLEHEGIPFVGSDALTMSLTLDKVMTKKILISEGIPTPRFFVADRPVPRSDVRHVKFPLIVKPRWEGSSKGITESAVVSSMKSLQTQIAFVQEYYHQAALVEEFVAGREFTVGFIGNGAETLMLPILEVTTHGKPLGERTYQSHDIYAQDLQYEEPKGLSQTLRRSIENVTRKTYDAVECLDFGRVDLRVDTNGLVFVLEINPLPALSREDAFGVAAAHMGMSYDEIIQRILLAGLTRYRLKNTGRLS